MSKSTRHAFNQTELLNWDAFNNISKQLGYKISQTGGAFITHQIDCEYEEFLTIKEMSNDWKYQ